MQAVRDLPRTQTARFAIGLASAVLLVVLIAGLMLSQQGNAAPVASQQHRVTTLRSGLEHQPIERAGLGSSSVQVSVGSGAAGGKQ
jgi:hypothetical protein